MQYFTQYNSFQYQTSENNTPYFAPLSSSNGDRLLAGGDLSREERTLGDRSLEDRSAGDPLLEYLGLLGDGDLLLTEGDGDLRPL